MKAIYSDLPKHLPKIFEPRAQIRVKDLSELNISELLNETYTTTPIQADKKTADGAVVTVNNKEFLFISLSWYTKTNTRTLSVQFNSERRLIVESTSRTTDHCGVNVSNLQAICPP